LYIILLNFIRKLNLNFNKRCGGRNKVKDKTTDLGSAYKSSGEAEHSGF
jgi:hypothetical protein